MIECIFTKCQASTCDSEANSKQTKIKLATNINEFAFECSKKSRKLEELFKNQRKFLQFQFEFSSILKNAKQNLPSATTTLRQIIFVWVIISKTFFPFTTSISVWLLRNRVPRIIWMLTSIASEIRLNVAIASAHVLLKLFGSAEQSKSRREMRVLWQRCCGEAIPYHNESRIIKSTRSFDSCIKRRTNVITTVGDKKKTQIQRMPLMAEKYGNYSDELSTNDA